MKQISIWFHKIINKYGRTRTFFVFAAIMILIISFGYNDVIIINRQCINLWQSIIKYGNPFHFYDIDYYNTIAANEQGKLAVNAMYDFSIYMIEGIWLFPLYIFSRITTVDLVSYWLGILWGKTLHVICTFICGYQVYRLAGKNMDEDKAIDASVYFLTSLVTCSSVYIIGQCDSIVILFIMLGLNLILDGKFAKGVAVFAIASSMKIFALFLLFVVLLLYEKKILRLLAYIIPAIAFIVSIKLIFRPLDSEAAAARSEWLMEQTKQMFSGRFPIMNSWIPIFPIFIIAVLYLCYFWTKLSYDYVIFFCFLIYFAAFISFDITPYWHLYMIPFVSIMVIKLDDYRQDAFLLSLVGEGGLVVGHYLKYYWCYDVNNVNRSLLSSLFGTASTETGFFRLSYCRSLIDWAVFGTFYAVFVVCFIGLASMYIKMTRSGGRMMVSGRNGNEGIYKHKTDIRLLIAYFPLAIYFANIIVVHIHK